MKSNIVYYHLYGFRRILRIPNIEKNFLRFFFGLVIILHNVSHTLIFTTRFGARFSNHVRKSINHQTFNTIILLSINHFLFSCTHISWKGVHVQFKNIFIVLASDIYLSHICQGKQFHLLVYSVWCVYIVSIANLCLHISIAFSNRSSHLPIFLSYNEEIYRCTV